MLAAMATAKSQPSHALPPLTDLPPATAELADALLTLRNRDEMLRFLRDLCTLQELEALGHRWQIVNLLEEGVPYLEIAERVGASTTTVTRVAQWLRHGAGGYHTAVERLRRKRR
jgi:TrpR-related protein YerC/YecD